MPRPASLAPRQSAPGVRVVIAVCVLLLGLAGGSAGLARSAAADPTASGRGPSLILPDEVIFVLDNPGERHLIQADGDPVPVLGAEGLPRGLRLIAHGDGSASLEGIATGPAGRTIVRVIAQNKAGSVADDLVVMVRQGPSFVVGEPLTFVPGEFGTVLIRTGGFPIPGLSLQGDLPAGLAFADNGDGTAIIAGTPLDGPGGAPVTLTAVNVVADASLTTRVVVALRPHASGGAGVLLPGSGPRRGP
ncbi:MAG: hypothetical protein L0H41_06535 [Microlunatus sp.]|nr:hypothetical protein [Microlunatus sp.]